MKARILCAVLLGACAPRALPLPAGHPARPDTAPAPVGEPSRTLAPGVATGEVPAPEPEAEEPEDHGHGHHHHHGGS